MAFVGLERPWIHEELCLFQGAGQGRSAVVHVACLPSSCHQCCLRERQKPMHHCCRVARMKLNMTLDSLRETSSVFEFRIVLLLVSWTIKVEKPNLQ